MSFRDRLLEVMGRGDFWLARIFFWQLTVQLFFQLEPFPRFFLLTLVSTIFVCSAARGAFALGLYAVIFPRLVRRSRQSDSKVVTLMPSPRSLRDSLQLSACSDTVLHIGQWTVWNSDNIASPFRLCFL